MFLSSLFAYRDKGFGVTEVIIVTAVVPTVAAAVIALLAGSLHTNAKDSNIRDGLKSLIKESEIYYSVYRTYDGFCLNENVKEIDRFSKDVNCVDSSIGGIPEGWAVEAQFNEIDLYYCVDSRGSKGITSESSISRKDANCNVVLDDENISKLIKK